MLRRTLILATASLAALALADHILVQGSSGQGTATGGGREGQFHYAAESRTDGVHTRLHGRLAFTEHHAGVTIMMGTLDKLAVNGNVATFNGRGSLTRSGQHGVHGFVYVVATNNRDLHHPHNPPDTFSIEFHDEHHNMVYSFRGEVGHGDLTVFTRRAH